MQTDIEQYVKQCPGCLRFKILPERTELNPIVATCPWELIHIDFLTIEAPKNSKSLKDMNLLIVTDHFTRYAQAFVTILQQAPVVASVLWDTFFMYYGIPENFYQTRAVILKANSLKSYRPHHIGHKPMTPVKALIEP